MLPETAHVQLLIALKCGDELLAVSKLCKTTVAAAVGAAAPGQYVPIVVSSMENTMVIAACSTNPELVGFTGFTDVTSDKSVAKTKGGGTDKTVEIDKDLQAKLHSVDMQNWAPPPDFKLPDGTAADAKLGPAARASLCFSVISDFLLLIGPYPSTGQKAQKQFIALRCGEVIPSSFLTPPTGHTKWDWGDEIWKWKAKGLINGGGAYHASVIVPVAHSTAAAGVALANGAVGDAILGAILTAQTRGGVRWTLSSLTRQETRAAQQQRIDDSASVTRAANLAAEQQLATYRETGGLPDAIAGGGANGEWQGPRRPPTSLSVEVFGVHGVLESAKGRFFWSDVKGLKKKKKKKRSERAEKQQPATPRPPDILPSPATAPGLAVREGSFTAVNVGSSAAQAVARAAAEREALAASQRQAQLAAAWEAEQAERDAAGVAAAAKKQAGQQQNICVLKERSAASCRTNTHSGRK